MLEVTKENFESEVLQAKAMYSQTSLATAVFHVLL